MPVNTICKGCVHENKHNYHPGPGRSWCCKLGHMVKNIKGCQHFEAIPTDAPKWKHPKPKRK